MYDPQAEFYHAMRRSRQEAAAADRAASAAARRSHLCLSELHASTAAAIARRAVEIGIDGGRARRSAMYVALAEALSRGYPRSRRGPSFSPAHPAVHA